MYNHKAKCLFLQRSIFIWLNLMKIQLWQVGVMTDAQQSQCLAPVQCFC